MRDKVSFKVCSSKRDDEMSAAIAAEAKWIVQRAAEPVFPGETVKAQMNRAWSQLGRPAFWRVRAAWYEEAGCWSAAALVDFRARYRAWRERQEARARADVDTAIARTSAQLAALTATDPDFYREEVSRLRQLLEQLRNTTVGGLRT